MPLQRRSTRGGERADLVDRRARRRVRRDAPHDPLLRGPRSRHPRAPRHAPRLPPARPGASGPVLRGKRLGFDLGEIARIVDMYDQEPGEEGQLRYLLDQIERRRAELEQRRRDIEDTLAELEAVEARCRDALARQAPAAPGAGCSLRGVTGTGVLVLNCGSSSVKYALVDPATRERAAGGTVERVGEGGRDHADAVRDVLAELGEAGAGGAGGPRAVGHRVVHGGPGSPRRPRSTTASWRRSTSSPSLAPLHNPGSAPASGRRARPCPACLRWRSSTPRSTRRSRRTRPRTRCRASGASATACAGTASTGPPTPTSSGEAARLLGPERPRGRPGRAAPGQRRERLRDPRRRSVDTSMGLTPLEGLVMGTRSGDVDPSVPGTCARVAGLTPARWTTPSSTRAA